MGRCLLHSGSQALTWNTCGSFPGESWKPMKLEECIIREIKEEMDIDIEVDDIYKVVKFKYEEKTYCFCATFAG